VIADDILGASRETITLLENTDEVGRQDD